MRSRFNSIKYVTAAFSAFAALLLAPETLDGVPARIHDKLSRTRLVLDESLQRINDLERSRAAGWMTGEEFAHRARIDVIPTLAVAANELQSRQNDPDFAWFRSAIVTLNRKATELETLALIYEAKDRLAKAESALRAVDFATTANAMDDFWVSSRSKIETHAEKLRVFSTAGADALESDLSRLERTAFQIEVLLSERHLANLKSTALANWRGPASTLAAVDWTDLRMSTQKQIFRLGFVERVYPKAQTKALKERFDKVERLLGAE